MIQASLIGDAVDDGPALVFVADENMKYVAVNRFAAHALGYTREELLELHVTDVVRTTGAPDDYETMMRDGSLEGSAILTCSDGSELPFRYRASSTQIAGLDFFVSVGFVDGED